MSTEVIGFDMDIVTVKIKKKRQLTSDWTVSFTPTVKFTYNFDDFELRNMADAIFEKKFNGITRKEAKKIIEKCTKKYVTMEFMEEMDMEKLEKILKNEFPERFV